MQVFLLVLSETTKVQLVYKITQMGLFTNQKLQNKMYKSES